LNLLVGPLPRVDLQLAAGLEPVDLLKEDLPGNLLPLIDPAVLVNDPIDLLQTLLEFLSTLITNRGDHILKVIL
jgi:hypothetical protein